MTRGYSDEYEKEYIKKDGSLVPISIRTWLLYDENGEPTSMWAIVRNITERKKLLEEQIQMEKLTGVLEMAGAASHELNQPMQVIYGYTELLLKNMSEDNPENKYLTIIKSQIERMAEITKNLKLNLLIKN